jgi:uncharacterized membrane protein
MIMHNNTLYITCIALVNCGYHLHMRYITRSQNLGSKRSKTKEYSVVVHKPQVMMMLILL